MTIQLRIVPMALALLIVPCLARAAAPQFAAIFTDHAVLQRGSLINVWGTANPSEHLSVALNGADVPVTAGADGRWRANLPAQIAGGPYRLSVRGTDGGTVLSDIMVGDVFLCSGQSNMELPVKYAINANDEIRNSTNDRLRFFHMPRNVSPVPLGTPGKPTEWTLAGPETSGDVSGVCYYMSQAIQKEQNVAIGFIEADWGGSAIQTWISSDGLNNLADYRPGVQDLATYAHSPSQGLAAWSHYQAHALETNPALARELPETRPDFDDGGWSSVVPGGDWEKAGAGSLARYQGVTWFRTHFTATGNQPRQAARLNLGAIGGGFLVWVDGVQVGTTGLQPSQAISIPAGVVRDGDNAIVVREVSTTEGSAAWGPLSGRSIRFGDGPATPLPQTWKYKMAGDYPIDNRLPVEPWLPTLGLAELYNGMIAPAVPYTIRAVAWYQGEANRDDPNGYASLLSDMMSDWRARFGQPNLPFLVVQLSGYGPVAPKPGESNWAELRDVQRRIVDADPRAGLAVAVDLGDRFDIHPAEKKTVGLRLARAADAVVYGESITPGGPEATSVTPSGQDLVVAFKDVDGELRTYSSDEAIGFETCTPDDVCAFVDAEPQGDKIILKGANTPGASKVRYAWADSPYTNLYSADDLPAVPFEMDVKR